MANNTTLQLVKGEISLEDALDNDRDIIRELSYPEKKFDFACFMIEHRRPMAEVVARHLKIPPSDLTIGGIGEVREWRFGSFNLCIPIHIENARNPKLPRRVIIRFPQPYKVGEASYPGNADEKLRCEAATYIWLQENCPSVPIPRLFGFGFPGTQSFTSLENETLWNRMVWLLRRAVAWFSGFTLPPYFAHYRCALSEVGYLLIEHVEEGKMLSVDWEEHRHDSTRRANLFRGLTRIMVSLAKLPLPRIGSWTMDDRGVLTLTNRPLTDVLHQLENAEIPTGIPRDLTYASAEAYYLDLLACQDNRMRHQPNSIHDEVDGEMQLAAITGLRALLPKFIDRRSRGGPFVLSLTDLHQSNIFVDDDWHITRMIDLEWACVLPLQMLGPPYWLTNRGVDQLTGLHLDDYSALYHEFVDNLEKEELASLHSTTYSQMLRETWITGRYWYSRALDCPDALCSLFARHLEPRFGEYCVHSNKVLTRYWDEGASDFISSKVAENERYNDQVREMFAAAAAREADEMGDRETESKNKADAEMEGENTADRETNSKDKSVGGIKSEDKSDGETTESEGKADGETEDGNRADGGTESEVKTDGETKSVSRCEKADSEEGDEKADSEETADGERR